MRTHLAVAVVFGVLVAPAYVWGQSRSSGMFGGSSVGRSGPSSSSMGRSTSMGMGGMGMSGMGMSGMGMSGMGGMGGYGSGFIGASGLNNANLLGGNMASQYGGRSNYGSSLGGMSRTGMGQYGQSGYRPGGSYGASPYGGGYGSSGGYGMAAPGVAKKLSLDHTIPSNPAVGPGQVITELSVRLGSLPAIQTKSPITVAIQGETAILRGVVATQHDREVAARVMLLEPRVSSVMNELEVAGTAESTPPKR